jgi:hypothetical protein
MVVLGAGEIIWRLLPAKSFDDILGGKPHLDHSLWREIAAEKSSTWQYNEVKCEIKSLGLESARVHAMSRYRDHARRKTRRVIKLIFFIVTATIIVHHIMGDVDYYLVLCQPVSWNDCDQSLS